MSEGPVNAPALAELCALLETPDQQLLPDAVGLSLSPGGLMMKSQAGGWIALTRHSDSRAMTTP